MGNNFFTPYVDKPTPGYTVFNAAAMNVPFGELDRAIGYGKNLLVMPGGPVLYDPSTGILSWTETIEILFNRTDGQAIRNTIAAGSVTLADNEFAYVNLSETDAAAITVQKAAYSTGAASNFIAYGRVLLGAREADSDRFREGYLRGVEGKPILKTSATSVTIDWSKGPFQKITLGHDVTFTFTGAKDGDRLILRLTQDGAGDRAVTWPASVRYCSDIPSLTPSSAPGGVDYAGFIFDADAGTYDAVSFVRGLGVISS